MENVIIHQTDNGVQVILHDLPPILLKKPYTDEPCSEDEWPTCD